MRATDGVYVPVRKLGHVRYVRTLQFTRLNRRDNLPDGYRGERPSGSSGLGTVKRKAGGLFAVLERCARVLDGFLESWQKLIRGFERGELPPGG